MNNEEANESVNQLCLTGSSTGGELHSMNGGEGSPPSKNATSNDEGLEADVDREREWSPRSHEFNDDQGIVTNSPLLVRLSLLYIFSKGPSNLKQNGTQKRHHFLAQCFIPFLLAVFVFVR